MFRAQSKVTGVCGSKTTQPKTMTNLRQAQLLVVKPFLVITKVHSKFMVYSSAEPNNNNFQEIKLGESAPKMA